MKKQVILIRGWVAKENYKDFYDFLEKQDYNPYKEKHLKWSDSLKENLWDEFDFIQIYRPNSGFSDYKAWKISFEKIFPFLNDEIIFVVHSLWWSFLSKYFNEENIDDIFNKINKIIFVAPAFKDDNIEVLWTFNFSKDFSKLQKIQDKIIIFGSKDDPILSFSNVEDYMNIFPQSNHFIFEDRGHFLIENFPELIKEIKK